MASAAAAPGVAAAGVFARRLIAAIALPKPQIVTVLAAVTVFTAAIRKRQQMQAEEKQAAAEADVNSIVDFFGAAMNAALDGTAAVASASFNAIGEIDLTAPVDESEGNATDESVKGLSAQGIGRVVSTTAKAVNAA